MTQTERNSGHEYKSVAVIMKKEGNHSQEADKKLIVVCGLYCGACSWFIAATLADFFVLALVRK
jgi:hypothetical protein